MKKPRQMMVQRFVAACAAAFLASAAPGGEKKSLSLAKVLVYGKRLF